MSNIDQKDLDGDGTGDACDRMTCGNGQQELSEECDDAGASASCDANCFRVPEPASGLLQLTALLTLLALRRRQSLRR